MKNNSTIEEFIHKGINTGKEYQKIFESLPHDISMLRKKYNIIPETMINQKGGFADIYFIGDDAIKVNKFNKGHINNWLLNETKKEVTNQKLAETLGLYVPKNNGIYITNDNGTPSIGHSMRNLGDLVIKNLQIGNEKDLAIQSWGKEMRKASKLLTSQPDMHDENAIWVPEENQTYLIDTELWNFKGVDYTKY